MKRFNTIIVLSLYITLSNNSYSATKVGVISLFKNEVTLINIGLTAFDSVQTQVPINEWGINDKIMYSVNKIYSTQKNINLIKINRKNIEINNISTEYNFFNGMRLNEKSISILKRLGKKDSLDFILVFLPSTINYRFGYGLYYYKERYIETFFSSSVYVINLKTGISKSEITLYSKNKFIAQRELNIKQKEMLYEYIIGGYPDEQIEKWQKIIFSNDITDDYKKIILRTYEEENSNSDEEDLESELEYIEYYLNQPHHKVGEFYKLPKKDMNVVMKAIFKNIQPALDSKLKGLIQNI